MDAVEVPPHMLPMSRVRLRLHGGAGLTRSNTWPEHKGLWDTKGQTPGVILIVLTSASSPNCSLSASMEDLLESPGGDEEWGGFWRSLERGHTGVSFLSHPQELRGRTQKRRRVSIMKNTPDVCPRCNPLKVWRRNPSSSLMSSSESARINMYTCLQQTDVFMESLWTSQVNPAAGSTD